MKFVNILIGLLIFSVISVLIFGVYSTQTKVYSSESYYAYSNITNRYDVTAELMGENSSSTVQGISKQVTFAQLLADVIPGAKEGIAAAKLIQNTVTTTDKISEKAVYDLGLPSIVYTGIKGLFVIVFIIIAFIAIRGVKPDTD